MGIKTSVLFFICLIGGFHITVSAQDYALDYANAKAAFSEKRYVLAMESFLPLCSEKPENAYALYAQYYYGLSAYHAKDYTQAYAMLQQNFHNHREWEQEQEVTYTLALVCKALGKIEEGFTLSQSIRNRDVKVATEKFIIRDVNSLDTLRLLNTQYRDNRTIGIAYLNALYRVQVKTPEQKQKSETLWNQFKPEPGEIKGADISTKKANYRIAALLPLNIDQTNPNDTKRSNQYAWDMYQGMQLAADSLSFNGPKVSLYVYDTDKDLTQVQKWIKAGEFSTMDAVVGPLTPQLADTMLVYCKRERKLMVHPLSINIKNTVPNASSYLFHAPIEQQVHLMLNFADSNFTKPHFENTYRYKYPKPKRVVIAYGPDPKDSVYAFRYRDTAKARGFEVVQFVKLSATTLPALTNKLRDSLFLLNVSHVAAFTRSNVHAANIISALEVGRQRVPIFTYPNWLEFTESTFEQYERREVYFIMPDHVNRFTPAYANFHERYVKRYAQVPSEYAIMGFEMMLIFGNALKEAGDKPAAYLQMMGHQQGYLMDGWDFSGTCYNQFSAITCFDQLQIKTANLPSPIAPK
jgi:ABC-type branched-subunit amino acid transport system substrate-binding protein